MPKKSLLWDEKQNTAERKKISENVIKDLMLEKDFRPVTYEYLTVPCTDVEIIKRQRIISAAMSSPDVREQLKSAAEITDRMKTLLSELERSSFEEEKILLFPPLLKLYFEVNRIFSGIKEVEADYFEKILERDSEDERKYAFAAAKFDGKMKLRLKGTEIHSLRAKDSFRGELERIFNDMELSDAIPPELHVSKASPQVVKAFASLNSTSPSDSSLKNSSLEHSGGNDYYTAAKALYISCAEKYLSGEADLREFVKYGDEARFVLDVSGYFLKLREAGYPVVFPDVSESREVAIDGLYDPSLLKRGISAGESVPNEVRMCLRDDRRENFFILTGANGGGKTTYLRACSLAVLFFITGCPIAAEKASIYPFGSLYTHFPSNESFEDSGRFVNEAARAQEIIDEADENSFAVFNETYSGTDEIKSEGYSRRLADEMYDRGVFGIFVTHIHSLTGGRIPTLAAVIDESDENRRTYKIKRVSSTDSSFAEDILKKYGLDKKSLLEKLNKINAEGGESDV